MITLKNTAKGARGILFTDGTRQTVDGGKTVTVDGSRIASMAPGLVEASSDEIVDAAEPTVPQPPKGIELPSLTNMTKAELEDQAEAEGVDLDTVEGSGKDGFVTAADIKGAIEAHRAA